MVKIIPRKDLMGDEKFGSCADCGEGTDAKEIYKIEFDADGYGKNRTSISLCWDCLIGLGNMVYDMYQEECVSQNDN